MRALLLLPLFTYAGIAYAGVSPENPTGVRVNYTTAWLNPQRGEFGGTLSITQTAPKPPTVFSLQFKMSEQTVLVTDVWGSCSITKDNNSGVFHLQPMLSQGTVPTPSNCYFNAKFFPNGGQTTAIMPYDFSLLKGMNFTSTAVKFQPDDITINNTNVPTAATGPFLTNQNGLRAATSPPPSQPKPKLLEPAPTSPPK